MGPQSQASIRRRLRIQNAWNTTWKSGRNSRPKCRRADGTSKGGQKICTTLNVYQPRTGNWDQIIDGRLCATNAAWSFTCVVMRLQLSQLPSLSKSCKSTHPFKAINCTRRAYQASRGVSSAKDRTISRQSRAQSPSRVIQKIFSENLGQFSLKLRKKKEKKRKFGTND